MTLRRFHIAISILLLVSPAANGQSTRPAGATDQASEQTSLRISDSDAKAAAVRSSASPAASTGTGDLSRIAIALVAVICLILLLRGVFRNITIGSAGGKGSRLVTVLSRSPVSPKQQVLVLQVGRRLLIVSDSAGHMSCLSEITDPDEIAAMVGQTRHSTPLLRSAGSFGNLFRRANEPFGETDALQMPSEEEAFAPASTQEGVSAEEVGGLLDKVRMLQQQFNEPKQTSS